MIAKMKPILFNAQMVRAILDGRKTQTRRIVKPQPIGFTGRKFIFADDECPKKWEQCDDFISTALYHTGDVLYVRETWTKLYYVDPDGYTHFDQPMYYYAADGTPDITLRDADGFELEDQRIRWRPSIHMPKEAARIFLRVTDVRVERLGDISSEDVYAEGTDNRLWAATRDAFRRVWDSTIKPSDIDRYGWDANPWVWVISFERYDPAAPEGGAVG